LRRQEGPEWVNGCELMGNIDSVYARACLIRRCARVRVALVLKENISYMKNLI
jgi:hypothetical protein